MSFFLRAFLLFIWAAPHENHLSRYLEEECKPASIEVMSAWALDSQTFLFSPKVGRWNVISAFHLEHPEQERQCSLFPVNRLKGLGATQVGFSRQWTTKNIFVPRIQPASKVFPLVLTFTVTRACFLLSELQPAPHKGVGVLPEKPLRAPADVPGKPALFFSAEMCQ